MRIPRLLPALLLLLTSCASFVPRFEEPGFTLDGVVVRSLDLTGGRLDLLVAVDNPNDFALEGTALRLGLEVEDDHVGDVRFDDDFRIARNGVSRVTLPLTFNWAGVGGAFRTMLAAGELPYTIRGEAGLRTPWGLREVPFSASGRVPLTRTAAAPRGR